MARSASGTPDKTRFTCVGTNCGGQVSLHDGNARGEREEGATPRPGSTAGLRATILVQRKLTDQTKPCLRSHSRRSIVLSITRRNISHTRVSFRGGNVPGPLAAIFGSHLDQSGVKFRDEMLTAQIGGHWAEAGRLDKGGPLDAAPKEIFRGPWLNSPQRTVTVLHQVGDAFSARGPGDAQDRESHCPTGILQSSATGIVRDEEERSDMTEPIVTVSPAAAGIAQGKTRNPR
ncbi:uncharacterized protein B0H64DRAFT_372341 [Chaetomium fimeti]|uniref:Uncharacterized protein n=1 Tax=Chaetomium fimeti TaxID=1854472 RepID=A0AAE0HI08_9PEZI|nr:hypothetical protein B0H64DRAFT_372341 [Chaetomium fimeti]